MERRTAVLVLGLSFSTVARAADSGPSPSALSSYPVAEALIAEVPFLTSDEPNRIVVDLAPEGYAPFRMMIDTGAGDSVVTPRYASKLGVIVKRAKDTPYRHATRLGRDLQFWVDVRRTDTASRTGDEYGLLGGPFLREYVVEFDFVARQVRFLDPERYRVPDKVEAENEAVIPIKVVGNRPIIDVSVGGEPVQVMIDTGDWDAGVLSGVAAQKVHLQSISLAGLRYGSVVGPVEVEFGEAESLRLGPFELGHVPLIVAPKGWYNMGSSTDSIIGYDVLSQFTVRIDYPHQRLWLKRRGDYEMTYCGVSYAVQRQAGLLVCPTPRGLEVIGLFPDAPAANLGIRAGDVVLPIDGEKAAGFESKTLDAVAIGKGITVTRKVNGVSIDVPLPPGGGDSTTKESSD
jgi:predicted aspartyl protease